MVCRQGTCARVYLRRNQISNLGSPKSIYPTFFSLFLPSCWKLEVWLQYCLCVNVVLGAVKFDAWVKLMAHLVPGTNQFAAEHSCLNAAQCPFSLVKHMFLYQRTRSISKTCGNIVETNKHDFRHFFLWLYWQCMSGDGVKWLSGCGLWRGSACC